MSEAPVTKKIWDRTAWRDAAFFLHYLKPHYNVFIPAMIALALTAGLPIMFRNLLASLAGKGLSGAKGPEWMAELRDTIFVMVGIVSAQAARNSLLPERGRKGVLTMLWATPVSEVSPVPG